jgi:hypothetical protein
MDILAKNEMVILIPVVITVVVVNVASLHFSS